MSPSNTFVLQFDPPRNKFILSIAYYATVSIGESVYVISGVSDGSPIRMPTIAQYKDGIWTHIGDLKEERYYAVAISLGSTIMVAGRSNGVGQTGVTETFDVNTLERKTLPLALNSAGMFLVPHGYCSKN